MKRLAGLLAVLVGCGLLTGCGNESRTDLITDTVKMMNDAAVQMGSVTKQVNVAVEKAKKEGTGKQLDLSAAIKATETLRKTGDNAQKIKARLEAQRESITEKERESLHQNEDLIRDVNNAYGQLVKEKRDLEKALTEAAAINRRATDQLRDKIREAVGPFESLARQS